MDITKEIERKFLVSGTLPKGMEGRSIRQGYLQTQNERTVRIRTIEISSGKKGILTIKGIGDKSGISRYEFEIKIPVSDADYLLTLCDQPLIEKTRYKYNYEGLTWEIDKFHGVNESLVIAEVELETIDQKIIKPDFVGKEVTGDIKYYSLMLIKNPYTTWG